MLQWLLTPPTCSSTFPGCRATQGHGATCHYLEDAQNPSSKQYAQGKRCQDCAPARLHVSYPSEEFICVSRHAETGGELDAWLWFKVCYESNLVIKQVQPKNAWKMDFKKIYVERMSLQTEELTAALLFCKGTDMTILGFHLPIAWF